MEAENVKAYIASEIREVLAPNSVLRPGLIAFQGICEEVCRSHNRIHENTLFQRRKNYRDRSLVGMLVFQAKFIYNLSRSNW